MRKSVLIIILLWLLVSAYTYYSLPVDVSYKFEGMEIKLDHHNESREKKVSFHFEGRKYRKLFYYDFFKGHLIMNDKKYKAIEFHIGSQGLLATFEDETGQPQNIGVIYSDENFEKISILIHENGNFSSTDGIILAGPGNNKAEILSITRELLEQTNNSYNLNNIKQSN